MFAVLWPFLIYWAFLFVACFVVVEYGQNYLYDETTPRVGLKVAVGSAILAGFLTWRRSSYDTMFTEDLGWTVIQAIVWFGVFTLIYQFQPWHGGAIGVVMLALVAGLATLGVESMLSSNRAAVLPENTRPNKPLRQPAGPQVRPLQVTPVKSDEPAGKAAPK